MGEEYEEMVSPGASLSAAERTATKSSAATVAEPRATHNFGPWRMSGPTGYGDIKGHRVTEPLGYVLAVAIGDVPELHSEANARLIALCPEMFEYIASSASNGCATAKALVAKAEGRS